MNFSWRSFVICCPFLFAALLITLGTAPVSWIAYDRIPIPFVLPVIFFYAVYRPMLLNVICVFLLGIYADLLTQAPFGFCSFFLVLFFFVANLKSRLLMTFSYQRLWLVFAGLTFALDVISAAVFSLLTQMPFLYDGFVMRYVLVLMAYPLLMKMASRLDESVGLG